MFINGYGGVRAGPVTPTQQALAEVGALGGAPDSWGGYRPDTVGRGGNLLSRSTPFRVWSQRAFIDQGRTTDALGVSIVGLERDDAGYRLRLSLPAGATVSQGGVRVGNEWFNINPGPASLDQGPGEIVTSGPQRIGKAPGDANPPAWSLWSIADPGTEPIARMIGRQAPATWRPANGMALNGPDRRGQAIEARIARGSYAGVYLQIEGLPPDVTLENGGVHRCSMSLRALVPLGDKQTPSQGKP
jgi:hypothetical protein